LWLEQQREVGAELADAASKGSTEPAERENITPPSMVVRTKVARA
jgi:hypothetical protein